MFGGKVGNRLFPVQMGLVPAQDFSQMLAQNLFVHRRTLFRPGHDFSRLQPEAKPGKHTITQPWLAAIDRLNGEKSCEKSEAWRTGTTLRRAAAPAPSVCWRTSSGSPTLSSGGSVLAGESPQVASSP